MGSKFDAISVRDKSEVIECRFPKDEVFGAVGDDEEPERHLRCAFVRRRSELAIDFRDRLNHNWVLGVDGTAPNRFDRLDI